jgi:hypothetical protein
MAPPAMEGTAALAVPAVMPVLGEKEARTVMPVMAALVEMAALAVLDLVELRIASPD